MFKKSISYKCVFRLIFRNKLKLVYGYYVENDVNLMYEIGIKGRVLDFNVLF